MTEKRAGRRAAPPARQRAAAPARAVPAKAARPAERGRLPGAKPAARPERAVARGNAVAHVYDTLRAEILSLRLAPGADLDDATLVERLGVSRTPIREALARLAGDGLVVQSPNRGVQVAPINLMDLPRYFEALQLLQRAVMRAAALRRTDEDVVRIESAHRAFAQAASHRDALELTLLNRALHVAIAEASHNRYLADGYSRLLDEGMRMLSVPFGYDPGEADDSVRAHTARVDDEHREMLDAIRDQDAVRAETLGASHAELFRSRFIAYFERNLLAGVAVDGAARRDGRGGG